MAVATLLHGRESLVRWSVQGVTDINDRVSLSDCESWVYRERQSFVETSKPRTRFRLWKPNDRGGTLLLRSLRIADSNNEHRYLVEAADEHQTMTIELRSQNQSGKPNWIFRGRVRSIRQIASGDDLMRFELEIDTHGAVTIGTVT